MRIAPSGKVLKLGGGINHFQAKKPRQKQLGKKRHKTVDKIRTRMLKAYLYH